MKPDELQGKYQRLRSELATAYAAPVWDSRHIDRIAAEMAVLEQTFASSRAPRDFALSDHGQLDG